MKYMLLIYLAEDATNEDERAHCYVESTQLAHDLNAAGKYLAAAPLHPTATATSIRVRDGKPLVTDAPSPRRASTWAVTSSSTSRSATRNRRNLFGGKAES